MTPAKSKFYLKPTTVDVVLELIKKMSSDKAAGLGGLSCRIIKVSTPVIAPTLVFIFNKAIETGIFLDDWKIARVTPLHKNASKSNSKELCMINYISICAQMILYLNFNLVFEPYILKQWLRSSYMVKGLINGVLYLDLNLKAFDSVDH